jgi:hypothetical protein
LFVFYFCVFFCRFEIKITIVRGFNSGLKSKDWPSLIGKIFLSPPLLPIVHHKKSNLLPIKLIFISFFFVFLCFPVVDQSLFSWYSFFPSFLLPSFFFFFFMRNL